MNYAKTLLAGALLAALGTAHAAVSTEEAKQLGTTLTRVGAETTANADGTIPAYTGGLTTPPASFKAGSSIRPDPYASEKPRLTITATNMAKYEGQLTAGARALLKKYPKYRIDVYPTHRSVALPDRVLDNTVGERDARQHPGRRSEHLPAPSAATRSRSRRPATRRCGTTCCATLAWQVNFKYDNWNVDASGTPALSTSGKLLRRVPVLRPEEHQAGRRDRRLLPHQDLLRRPGTPRRRSADGGRRGQSVQAVRAAPGSTCRASAA